MNVINFNKQKIIRSINCIRELKDGWGGGYFQDGTPNGEKFDAKLLDNFIESSFFQKYPNNYPIFDVYPGCDPNHIILEWSVKIENEDDNFNVYMEIDLTKNKFDFYCKQFMYKQLNLKTKTKFVFLKLGEIFDYNLKTNGNK